jgi:excisionase family DNA binding protein
MTETLPKVSLDDYPDILNPKMVAEYLGISYGKALGLIKLDLMPCLKVGNIYKIPKSGFVKWLEEPGYREFL